MSDAQQILGFLVQMGSRLGADEVRHVIPAIVFELLRREPETEVPAAVAAVLTQWMKSRKLESDASDEQVRAALVQTYQERPIHSELKLGLAELLRDLGVGSSKQLRQFLDQDPQALKPIEDKPPPDGAVKNNPFARFALQKDREE